MKAQKDLGHGALKRRYTHGQAMVEWLIAVSLLGLAVVSVQGGPLEHMVSAIGAHYQRYTHAMARP
jgi:hypothetical protein